MIKSLQISLDKETKIINMICFNCGCIVNKNWIQISYDYNVPEHRQMLGEKIIKEMENDKEDYKRKEERRKIREVKEWKNLSNDEIDKIILLREWISGKSAKNNENYCFPEHLNIKKVEYCNYCSPYFQELEIKRLNKVSIKEWYEETVSQETFTDFVDNSEKWHQRQLAEKDKIIESKDKEIYELKLQVKDQKIEELTKQVEELKCLIEQNIKR